MICRDHPIPIAQQAHLLGMSRSAVYYLPRPPSAADLAIIRSDQAWALDTIYIPMARGQIRAGVPAGLRQRARSAGRHRPVH
jgi:hypothetical protein